MAAAVIGGPPAPGAGADEAVRSGWWSMLSPAPPPPDAPDDGLHVAGGPGGPSAVAAIVYDLAPGLVASTLTIEAVGVSPRADGVQACAIPVEGAGFEPAQNGAWEDAPAYDCALGAAPVELDGSAATFAIGPLQQGSTLAVAIVPGPTDRVSFAKPTMSSLAVGTPAVSVERPGSSAPIATAPIAAPSAPPTYAALAPLAPAPPVVPASSSAAEVRTTGDPGPSAAHRAVAAAVTSTGAPMRTRVGGALGFALLLGALIFYSQGRGLLGARVGDG